MTPSQRYTSAIVFSIWRLPSVRDCALHCMIFNCRLEAPLCFSSSRRMSYCYDSLLDSPFLRSKCALELSLQKQVQIKRIKLSVRWWLSGMRQECYHSKILLSQKTYIYHMLRLPISQCFDSGLMDRMPEREPNSNAWLGMHIKVGSLWDFPLNFGNILKSSFSGLKLEQHLKHLSIYIQNDIFPF